MISNIRSYIQECLFCAKWIIVDRHVSLSFIQTYQFYDLFDIDFMNWFEDSIHDYKHFCNMIDYFWNDLFFYSTMSTKISNVKQSFQYHKFSDHFMFVAMYWNADIAFRFNEMKKMFKELSILCIIASSQSHKSLKMIKRDNRTLKTMLNKMKFSNENLVDILRKVAFACNERHVKHLKYISNEILHDIESFNSTIVRSVKTLLLFDKIILSNVEKMLSLVWNHMTKRKQIRQNVIQRM